MGKGVKNLTFCQTSFLTSPKPSLSGPKEQSLRREKIIVLQLVKPAFSEDRGAKGPEAKTCSNI